MSENEGALGIRVAHRFSFLCWVAVCLYSSCVLCAQCCKCLWFVHWWSPLPFSLTFFLSICGLLWPSTISSPATSVKALLKNLVLTSISKIVHMAFNNNYRHSLTHSIHPNVLCYIAMVRGYLLFAYYTIYQKTIY
jgi:hypothetical protein